MSKKNMVNLLVDAWWYRTLECIDLDNGGKVIPPPTEKQWKASVKRDIKKHLTPPKRKGERTIKS